MSSTSNSSSGGIGVLGLLGVVFVTLKLCGVIDWSWWYVTMPFWGGFALILLILGLMGAGLLALHAYEAVRIRGIKKKLKGLK